MQAVDLVLSHASQVVTCANDSQPKRGEAMHDVGIIKDGALAIHDGAIVAVGHTDEILASYQASKTVNVAGKAIIPGLIDCHTHVPYAGNRYDEFEMRQQGATYMDILQAGGGILSTVHHTRQASLDELVHLGHERLYAMMQLGTTTAELKTGYGLSAENETKLIQTIIALAKNHPMHIVPTFLGAHTIPPEFTGEPDAYIDMLLQVVMPQVRTLCAENNLTCFVDIFVEEGVFTSAHMQRYFETAQELEMPRKAHLDQFEHLGAVPRAIAMGATSVDHLEVTPIADLNILAQSNTVGVMLPAVNFNLGIAQQGSARYLIDAGGILALATDYNPGSSPTLNLPLVMALACRLQKLQPAEALNACTINAATALNMQTQIGSLEVGKHADFLVLTTDDYRAMIVEFGRNFVEQVYIGGIRTWKQSS
jgi:imidazolonepropionase